MKVVSDVLLLSYLDKFGLRVTVEAGQLWRVYIVKRGYIREPGWRLILSRLPHVLQATSLWGKESRLLQHTWNSKGFVISCSNSLLHNSLHFQHLMKTKG